MQEVSDQQQWLAVERGRKKREGEEEQRGAGGSTRTYPVSVSLIMSQISRWMTRSSVAAAGEVARSEGVKVGGESGQWG